MIYKMRRVAILLLILFASIPQAYAISEADVETAIAASSQEAVAGNLLVWFLCAVGFLKISQNIDSFLSSLGLNVGRTGGSMLTEAIIAGRALGSSFRLGGAARGSASGNSSSAAGQAFTEGSTGLVSVAKRAVGNAAAGSATGKASGLRGAIGGAMFGASLNNGSHFASDVVGAVATGNISTVGSISGEKAGQALNSYLGYQTGDAGSAVATAGEGSVTMPDGSGVSLEGGAAAGAMLASGVDHDERSRGVVMQNPPKFRDVEIGGGRITGFETAAGSVEERQFAMYNASQYMAPRGEHEVVQTADGESWYKQYAQPTVEKTPYTDGAGKVHYHSRIVSQMPDPPKRKDKI